MSIKILAIESSCDDTGAAVIINGKIHSNIVATQSVHEEYGGVVPELASRAHQQHIIPVVQKALKTAKTELKELNAIAFTKGPGLIGALLVGATFGKTLALSLDIPIIGVHHMKAHILAHFIEEPKPKFPFICLTVSGGHTQLVLVKDYLDFEILGTTIDDAAGEAFDKTAKLIGLPYPGGPMLDKLAKEGNPDAFQFARPRVPDLNYSFSGLKTSVLYFLNKQEEGFIEQNINDICASIQQAIIDALMLKLKKAAKEYKVKEIAIAGGVSANSGLRARLQMEGELNGWRTYIPRFEYCTDNAAMIAITAHFQYLAEDFDDQSSMPKARWPFQDYEQS